ncbi:MAG: serine/threonine-protein kinase [Kofleriaceae bacterium]|nr:serine/threonine-protein kinase [Kofleriaceae bacterium]
MILEQIGEYRIERQLARTRICLEYVGQHLVLPRRAVVKLMTPTAEPLPAQMLREACLLEALHHPGAVRVYESGLLADKRPWFARELVEGPTIASNLAPGMAERIDVISLLRDVADVLAHAHQRGVIHGNVRPDRIVMCGRSREFPICIPDWSEARAHDAASVRSIDSVASWYYTAPEVASGDSIDDRADVFSLGVIAYRLLTGQLPFAGSMAHTSNGHIRHVPTEVHCPEAPRELTGLVDQMLALDHGDRPSAADVHADLAWLAHVISMPAASATGLVRIRQPRWTPSLELYEPSVDADVATEHERD